MGQIIFYGGVLLLAFTFALAIMFFVKRPQYVPEDISGGTEESRVTQQHAARSSENAVPQERKPGIADEVKVEMSPPEGVAASVSQETAPMGQGTMPMDRGTMPMEQGTMPMDRGTMPMEQGTMPMNQEL